MQNVSVYFRLMKPFAVLLFLFFTTNSFSQIAKDFQLGIQVDLIKSDNDGFFEKIQSSAELNYFISRKFTATGGGEWWTDGNEVSFVIGGRWYPIPEAFIRLRGLIGANDICIGGGWAKPLNENWKFEAMGDIYSGGYIAIRAGFAYVIRRKAD